MRKINILFWIVASVMATGCYKDLGNYDYKDIDRLEIKFETTKYYLTEGDELEVNPIYPEIVEQHPEYYEFSWNLDGETRPEWNTRNFKWTSDRLLDFVRLTVEVKDKRTDVVYMNYVNVSVNGIYTNEYSWMILSDAGGKSKLSFLSVTSLIDQDSEDQPEGSDQYYYDGVHFITDVFDGELGTGPIAIQEHWREAIDWNETVIGNVCIFQESGAVDLEGSSFTKEIDMKDAFAGGQYPSANTILYPGSFIQNVDVVSDQDGRLYSRLKVSDKAYNSEYFLSTPMKVNGEDEALEDCIVCRGYYASNRIGVQAIYDRKNKRMLYLKDGDYGDAIGASMIIPVTSPVSTEPDPEDPDGGIVVAASESDFVPLEDHSGYELLYISQSAAASEGWSTCYSFNEILRHETDNKIYFQRFVTLKENVSYIEKTEICGLPAIPSVIAFPMYNAEPEYAFFAVGKQLYIVDFVNKSAVELYYEFDSNISAMDFGSKSNRHLAVGLEDGSFFVLGAIAQNIKDEHKLIYPRTAEDKAVAKTGGKIVDIKYKNNSMWNY